MTIDANDTGRKVAQILQADHKMPTYEIAGVRVSVSPATSDKLQAVEKSDKKGLPVTKESIEAYRVLHDDLLEQLEELEAFSKESTLCSEQRASLDKRITDLKEGRIAAAVKQHVSRRDYMRRPPTIRGTYEIESPIG